jgi:hypothetical protein
MTKSLRQLRQRGAAANATRRSTIRARRCRAWTRRLEIVETGYRVRSANLTPDANTGIGSWTEQQFIDKFKAFETSTNATLGEHERAQNTPMPMTMYAGMTREDLSAIFAYLRTLKPVTNRVEKFPDANNLQGLGTWI